MIISSIIPSSDISPDALRGNSIVAEGATSVCRLHHKNRVLMLCKTLKEEFATDKVYRAIFNKEYEVGSKLDCPYIVKYLSKTSVDDNVQLFLEYVEGATLQQLLETDSQWLASTTNLLKLMSQILKGLQTLHEQQIVHLDISPGNIMLTDVNHDVRIIDLGFCYSPSHPTPIGATASYGAPELFASQRMIDARADIYSFGRLMQDIIKTCCLSPSRELRDIQKIADRCCRENPDSRYQSAEEVLEQIEVLRNKKQNRIYLSPKFLWLLLSLVLLLVAGAALYLYFGNKDNENAPVTVLTKDSEVMPAKIIATDSTMCNDSLSKKVPNQADESTSKSKKAQSISPAVKISGNVFTINNVSFKMIPVEGGTFKMGNFYGEGIAYEKGVRVDEFPVHNVTLSSYMIGETEVTQDLWTTVMGKNPSEFPGGNLPVENVLWSECQEFITKLNELTHKKFRLPTEAEWEFAARGGNHSKNYFYSGSNDIEDVSWYRSNSDGKPHPVKTKKPNELGIYDMSGNVWEWVSDHPKIYTDEDQLNPQGPLSGRRYVIRGGAWSATDDNNIVSNRSSKADDGSYYLGFRLALEE